MPGGIKMKKTRKSQGDDGYRFAEQPMQTLQSFGHDGLEIARRRKRAELRLPLRQLCLAVLAVMSFKIFLFFEIGEAAYVHKMQELSQGITLERVAARLMPMDPLSVWIIDGIRFGAW